MSKISKNVRNGIGAIYETGPSDDLDNEHILFNDEAVEFVDIANTEGNCLVEGIPGAGKTHLVNDIRRAIWQTGRPALTLKAHISGGSKKGGENANYMMDVFAERHGSEGIIVIDNVDYFGYSGGKNKRSYPMAEAQLIAANKIIELTTDDSAPGVIGLAHTEEWRQAHWQYSSRRGVDNDEVTPVAHTIIKSFTERRQFNGTIDEDTAVAILQEKFPETETGTIDRTIKMLGKITNKLYFRHVNHLPIATGCETDIRQAIDEININTVQMMGKFALVDEDRLGLI